MFRLALQDQEVYKPLSFGFLGLFGSPDLGHVVDKDRPFLSPKEVVSLLLIQGIEVTDDTIRNWCKLGIQNEKRPEARYKLGSVRIGGRIYVIKAELEKFLPVLVDRIGI